MNRNADFETVREIKEKLCYIRLSSNIIIHLSFLGFVLSVIAKAISVFFSCSYDYKREYQLGLETTILMKNYTVSLISNLLKFFYGYSFVNVQ